LYVFVDTFTRVKDTAETRHIYMYYAREQTQGYLMKDDVPINVHVIYRFMYTCI